MPISTPTSGLVIGAREPASIVDKPADAARKACSTDAVETLHKQGYEAFDAGPDAFLRSSSELARWTEVTLADWGLARHA